MFFRPDVSVLFVCTANVCRSPMAHALFRHYCEVSGLKRRVRIDSAGTHVGLKGQRPDPRACTVLARHGIDSSRIKARPIEARDFQRFDYLLAMDREHLDRLNKLHDGGLGPRIDLVMKFAGGSPELEVPDPYYGNEAGFVRVFEMLEDSLQGFTRHLLEEALAERGTHD